MSEFLEQMAALSAAEEFFTILGVPFDQPVVHVKRLHILKCFNRRLAGLELADHDDETLRRLYAEALAAAYHEVQVTAPQEAGLFKVFRQAPPQTPGRAFVPLTAVTR